MHTLQAQFSDVDDLLREAMRGHLHGRGSFMIEKQKLVPGRASFTVRYESAQYTGESDKTEVTLR